MGVQSKFLKIALGAIFTGLPLGLPAAALSIRSFSGRTTLRPAFWMGGGSYLFKKCLFYSSLLGNNKNFGYETYSPR